MYHLRAFVRVFKQIISREKSGKAIAQLVNSGGGKFIKGKVGSGASAINWEIRHQKKGKHIKRESYKKGKVRSGAS